MNFMPALAIRILIADNCTSWRGIFKGLSQYGRRTDFSENLRASPFHKVLSNETNFSLIHLAGQYRYLKQQ
jgi:hypothetical protein